MKQKQNIWRHVLREMRINIIAFTVLLALSAAGLVIVGRALLRNARDTGTALARSYAAEESGSLAVYQTLLSFGAASIDRRLISGESPEATLDWTNLYFERLDMVLGKGTVDPYVVLDGKVWAAANPWEGDASYDVTATEWYRRAMENPGEVIFTNVYIDAIYGKPVITAAQKCQDSNAIMAFDIMPENIHFKFDSPSLNSGDSFFLCDSQGTLIYTETDLGISKTELQDYLNGLILSIGEGKFDSYLAHIIDTDGLRRAVYYSRMDNGWYSIITVPYRNILGELSIAAIVLFLMLALFLLVLIVTARREALYNARISRTNETVRVLGNSYYALYRINYQKGTYEMIKSSDYVRSRLPEFGAYTDLIRVAGEVIETEAYKDFAESFSQENIQRLVRQRIRNFGGEFLRLFDQEYRWVSVRILYDESLAPGEVVLCFREIGQERQRQMQERKVLEESLALAQKNEASRQAFFNNMSHDMRTPLNAIVGLSELAKQHAGDPEKTSEYLAKINLASRQLLNLINDILDMSRMEQGKVMVNDKEFDLRQCIDECLESFRFQAETEKKELELSMDIRDTHLLGDPFRINQLLNNLLSNAFKFTEEGGRISVSISQMDFTDYAKYKFVVADTGIGMSKEFLPHLFEPYSREMRFGSRQISGTGLGMPITKNLTAQMNGEIRVESEQGKGTAFTLILPFQIIPRKEDAAEETVCGQSPSSQAPASLKGKHILLAEDNEINMEITSELLAMNGVEVTQAWNGREAVEAFERSLPGFFDAVLMDMQMPEMDGCQAAKRIRALSRPDARKVPIIAVTANAFAEDIAATTAAGMDAHVSKPIDFGILCQTLGSLMENGGEHNLGPDRRGLILPFHTT